MILHLALKVWMNRRLCLWEELWSHAGQLWTQKCLRIKHLKPAVLWLVMILMILWCMMNDFMMYIEICNELRTLVHSIAFTLLLYYLLLWANIILTFLLHLQKSIICSFRFGTKNYSQSPLSLFGTKLPKHHGELLLFGRAYEQC